MNEVKWLFLNGCCNEGWFKGGIEDLKDFAIAFLTVEDRDAFVSLFPKLCKVRSGFISDCHESTRYPYTSVDMRVSIDKRTGEKNETAMRRRSKILEVLEKNSINPITIKQTN